MGDPRSEQSAFDPTTELLRSHRFSHLRQSQSRLLIEEEKIRAFSSASNYFHTATMWIFFSSSPCGTNGVVNNFRKTISKRALLPTKSLLPVLQKSFGRAHTHTHPVTRTPYPGAADRLGTGRKFPGRVGLRAVISQKSPFRVPFQEIIRHDNPRRYNTLPPPSSCGGRFKSSYPAPADPGRPAVAYPQYTRKATCQVFSTSCPRVVSRSPAP